MSRPRIEAATEDLGEMLANMLADAVRTIGPRLMATRDSMPGAGEAALSAKAEVRAGPCKGCTFKLVLILDPDDDPDD